LASNTKKISIPLFIIFLFLVASFQENPNIPPSKEICKEQRFELIAVEA